MRGTRNGGVHSGGVRPIDFSFDGKIGNAGCIGQFHCCGEGLVEQIQLLNAASGFAGVLWWVQLEENVVLGCFEVGSSNRSIKTYPICILDATPGFGCAGIGPGISNQIIPGSGVIPINPWIISPPEPSCEVGFVEIPPFLSVGIIKQNVAQKKLPGLFRIVPHPCIFRIQPDPIKGIGCVTVGLGQNLVFGSR